MIVLSLSNEEIVADVDVADENIREESYFYVERATGYVYEVRFFEDYAMVRPATPETTSAIYRIGLVDFSKTFSEYLGDSQVIRDYLWGEGTPENIVVDRKS